MSYQPSIITTLAMTLGEMQFRDNFIKGDNHPFKYELYGLFVICCIFLNLALMNLMVRLSLSLLLPFPPSDYLPFC